MHYKFINIYFIFRVPNSLKANENEKIGWTRCGLTLFDDVINAFFLLSDVPISHHYTGEKFSKI